MYFVLFQVHLAAQYITFELENLLSRPEQEPLLIDMIHAVSFIFLFNHTLLNRK